MSLETIATHLRSTCPGQSEEWYQRVAKEIKTHNNQIDAVMAYEAELKHQSEIAEKYQAKAARQAEIERQAKVACQAEVFRLVSTETRTRLIAMCGGDRALAERLAMDNGEESWADAIWRLERDRM